MDDFFKRLKKGIDKGITVVSAKSKELVDTAKINSQVAELSGQKDQTLQEIGAIVYQMSLAAGETGEAEAEREMQISAKCQLITDLEQQIAAKESELKQLRTDTQETLGKIICESCGATLREDAKFCSNCGAQMVRVEK
jgi:ribosomal protein L40E